MRCSHLRLWTATAAVRPRPRRGPCALLSAGRSRQRSRLRRSLGQRASAFGGVWMMDRVDAVEARGEHGLMQPALMPALKQEGGSAGGGPPSG